VQGPKPARGPERQPCAQQRRARPAPHLQLPPFPALGRASSRQQRRQAAGAGQAGGSGSRGVLFYCFYFWGDPHRRPYASQNSSPAPAATAPSRSTSTMSSQQQNADAGSAPSGPSLCANGCGFFAVRPGGVAGAVSRDRRGGVAAGRQLGRLDGSPRASEPRQGGRLGVPSPPRRPGATARTTWPGQARTRVPLERGLTDPHRPPHPAPQSVATCGFCSKCYRERASQEEKEAKAAGVVQAVFSAASSSAAKEAAKQPEAAAPSPSPAAEAAQQASPAEASPSGGEPSDSAQGACSTRCEGRLGPHANVRAAPPAAAGVARRTACPREGSLRILRGATRHLSRCLPR
jgi:hypothetical protein